MGSFDVRIANIRKKLEPKMPTITVNYINGSAKRFGPLKAMDEVLNHAAEIVSIVPDDEAMREGFEMLLDSETGRNTVESYWQ